MPSWNVGASKRRPSSGPHVALGQAGPDLGSRLEGAGPHAERLEHRVLEVGIEGLTLGPLQHVAQHRDAGVGVLGLRARLIDQAGPIEAGDGGRERRLGVVEVVADRRLPGEAGAMGGELPERDLPAERISGMEVGEIAGNRSVEAQLAPLDQLHHRDVGEELGDRSHAIHRGRGGGNSGGGVGPAESAGPHHSAAVHQRHRDGGNPVLRPLLLYHRGERPGHAPDSEGPAPRWPGPRRRGEADRPGWPRVPAVYTFSDTLYAGGRRI